MESSKPRKRRINVSQKTRAILQKEVNSICPFINCNSEDVAHFQVHHIDNNTANNDLSNLLMLCPTCHSKITKGDISYQEILILKNKLPNNSKIELYDIKIDTLNCSWEKFKKRDNAYYFIENRKYPFPIFEFHFINHFNETIILMDVELTIKHIYSGMGDIFEPQYGMVPFTRNYKLIIRAENEVHRIEDFSPLQIPANRAYILRFELLEQYLKQRNPPLGTQALLFKIKFNSNIELTLPKILLNTESEKGVKLLLLA